MFSQTIFSSRHMTLDTSCLSLSLPLSIHSHLSLSSTHCTLSHTALQHTQHTPIPHPKQNQPSNPLHSSSVSAAKPATPRLIQCAWLSLVGISIIITKFVECPVVDSTPNRDKVL